MLIFSVLMGALWLATVPLTSGLIAQIYGIRYMGTLYSIVFLSHQLGGFLGVWLGGRLYDIHGDYTLVWWVGIGVGAFFRRWSTCRSPSDRSIAAPVVYARPDRDLRFRAAAGAGRESPP